MSGRDPDLVIPLNQLPPGFAEQVDAPPSSPAPAVPAATVVLVREGAGGLEVLLLRRGGKASFVPGAYVFPGGRVDAADTEAALIALVDGLRPEIELGTGQDRGRGRGRGNGGSEAGGGSSAGLPAAAYWIAAAREVFEETGVLLARGSHATPVGTASPAVAQWRERLLEDRATMLDVLHALDARLDLGDMVYCAHWITPVAERSRYDTRFFLANLPRNQTVRADPREMTDAVWLAPATALDRFTTGTLPMVFPTVRTLESLVSFTDVKEAFDSFRGRRIETVLPRLVRTDGGVGVVFDEGG